MHLSQVNIESIQGTKLATIAKLNANNIYNVNDLLHMTPKKYEIYEVVNLNTAENNENLTAKGVIINTPAVRELSNKRTMIAFKMVIDGILTDILIFNREFLKGNLAKGKVCYVTGKYNKEDKQIIASKIQFGSQFGFKTIRPLYGIKDLPDYEITKIMSNAYIDYFKYIDDEMPLPLLEKYELISMREALKIAHSPKNKADLELFYKRFKFNELFKFQLKLQYLKLRNSKSIGTPKEIDNELLEAYISKLPFELTNNQKETIEDILTDLRSKNKMNRLVQGDVGSGKTLVSAIAMYATKIAGFQSAMMAPTEILAEQHYRYLSTLYKDTDVNLALLTGSTKAKEKQEIYARLESGEINIIVGTHALISDVVKYKNLGLVVTDEQHRFGVNQRKLLKDKGISPDVLFMTATPIPRTLAITIFGDMDVSTIKELPKGRKEITTTFISSDEMKEVYNEIQNTVNRFEQAFVVAPLIEDSDKLDVTSATTMFETLKEHLSSNVRLGLIHGRLSQDEKEQMMHKFLNHEIDVLVATTVIEVGVDIKNASLMVVLDANRFGLSQLHQLRGRIGRGELHSKCILVSEKLTHRLSVMVETTDGFKISEEDLKLRGYGDLFGSKQSGLPIFEYANLIEDFQLVETLRRETNRLVHTKVFYTDEIFKPLRIFLKKNMEQMELE